MLKAFKISKNLFKIAKNLFKYIFKIAKNLFKTVRNGSGWSDKIREGQGRDGEGKGQGLEE